jgi:hypothetical protein
MAQLQLHYELEIISVCDLFQKSELNNLYRGSSVSQLVRGVHHFRGGLGRVRICQSVEGRMLGRRRQSWPDLRLQIVVQNTRPTKPTPIGLRFSLVMGSNFFLSGILTVSIIPLFLLAVPF